MSRSILLTFGSRLSARGPNTIRSRVRRGPQGDYRKLPAYSSSFFPLAYRASGKPFPAGGRPRVPQDDGPGADGYLHDHIAATFHAAHYYRLLGEETPKADAMLARILREQSPDGCWMLNPLARDRHVGFDAAFMLKHLGKGRPDCQRALDRATRWASVVRFRNDVRVASCFPGCRFLGTRREFFYAPRS